MKIANVLDRINHLKSHTVLLVSVSITLPIQLLNCTNQLNNIGPFYSMKIGNVWVYEQTNCHSSPKDTVTLEVLDSIQHNDSIFYTVSVINNNLSYTDTYLKYQGKLSIHYCDSILDADSCGYIKKQGYMETIYFRDFVSSTIAKKVSFNNVDCNLYIDKTEPNFEGRYPFVGCFIENTGLVLAIYDNGLHNSNLCIRTIRLLRFNSKAVTVDTTGWEIFSR